MNEVPTGWVAATLQDIAKWSAGGTPSRSNSSYYSGTIPWFKTGELGPRTLTTSEEHISEDAINASSAKIFPKGSVAVAMYGATIGKTSIFGINAATNQACAVAIPDAVTSEFLYYFIVSQAKPFADAGQGGAQPNISQGIIKEWSLLLPPQAEQTRIVSKLEELLSELDAGVAELKAAQKKLHLYRQSLLKAAVEGSLTAEWRTRNTPQETGAELLARILKERRARWEKKQLAKFKEQGKTPPKGWQNKYPEPVAPDTSGLPELPEGWVWASVEQLLEGIESGKSFKCEERPPKDHEVGVVKVSAVTWGEYNEQESKTCHDESMIRPELFVRAGDFLFSRANTIELVGACVIAGTTSKRIMLSDKILRFVLIDDQLKSWLLTLLRSKFGRKHIETLASGNQESMRNIGQERLRQIPVPIPSIHEISHCTELLFENVSMTKQQEEAIQIAIKRTAAQRQNILRAAFAGELVPQDPNDEPASVLLERIRAERAAHGKAVKKTRGRKAKTMACPAPTSPPLEIL